MASKKNKKWQRPRHTFFRKVVNGLLRVYIKIKYGFKPTPYKGDKKQQYLVLCNHQTPLDQFFITISFRKTFYCVGSEDLFSAGFASRFMEYAIAPIPIKKQTSDFSAVMTCAKVAKEGGSIIIFPEGNRTYSGKTEYINPAITKFVKLLKLPLVFYKIEGGYGVYPRWSNYIRKGKMQAGVSKVIEYKDYANLDNQQLYDLIVKELYVNEAKQDNTYTCKKLAENLERLIYVCPDHGFSQFYSDKNALVCAKCGKRVEYLPDKTLKCTNGDLPFTFINDWYEYQKDYLNKLDPTQLSGQKLFEDNAKVYNVILFKNKKLLDKSSKIELYSDKVVFTVNGQAICAPFNQISSATVLGRNKLNLYIGDKVYQFKGKKSFNAIKYVNLYYRYTNFTKGDENGQFLGL